MNFTTTFQSTTRKLDIYVIIVFLLYYKIRKSQEIYVICQIIKKRNEATPCLHHLLLNFVTSMSSQAEYAFEFD